MEIEITAYGWEVDVMMGSGDRGRVCLLLRLSRKLDLGAWAAFGAFSTSSVRKASLIHTGLIKCH